GTLHRLTAAPRWHLLLCGPPAVWPTGDPAGLAQRYPGRLTVHRLTESDSTGGAVPAARALRRLGLAPGASAAYLVRPDGHVGYRSGGTDLTGLTAYLDRWLPS
ncbi:hypothetical protein ABT214_16095, partial [Micromonospora purpureochromogenes]